MWREPPHPDPAAAPLRALAEHVFSRAAGAPLIAGNRVRLLRDAAENYPAWLDAISSAQRSVFFENYIVEDDDIGRQFVEALAGRARSGVRVRVIYDWLGSFAVGARGLWAPLVAAGGEVRCFNPPRLDSPFGWLTRDHRKAVIADGRVAYISGLCVGQRWSGNPARGVEPWRDTGVEIRGPAVADAELAFAQVWETIGSAMPLEDMTDPATIAPEGDVAMRVLATIPNVAGLYRLDQLIAAGARRTLWIADAYFIGVSTYVQALRAAALDGVDVRLLVPGSTDLPLVSAVSRAGYRPLLEAGVRVFEWNGSMMHAKTAVADGRWARVGSSNLNLASWLGNYELDVAIEDETVAARMQEMYEDDLGHATEIVLDPRNRVGRAGERRRERVPRRGRVSRAAAGALRLGATVGAAIANRRVLGPTEAGVMTVAAVIVLAIAVVSMVWPMAIAGPVAALAAWIGVSLAVRAVRLRERHRAAQRDRESTNP